MPERPVRKHAELVQVSAAETLTLVVIAMLPCLIALWRQPLTALLPRASAYAALSGFMLGYHVHEKAAITAVVLLALEAGRTSQAKWCVSLRQ